jgi:phasin family protein
VQQRSFAVSDLPILPALESAESIPAALAAPKPKKTKSAEPLVSAPATLAEAPSTLSNPTAEVPAAITSEETTMATTIENMTQTATDKTQAAFADMSGRAQDAMQKSTKLFADWNDFNKGNVEALVESSKLAFAGMQTMAQDGAAAMRKRFEDATEAARTMTSVKSPTEFVKLQGDYVRQQFDGLVAETSRSTESMMKLMGEVAQPVANRVALAVEKVKAAA